MDTKPYKLIKDIENFKPFSFREAQELYARELAKSIILMLKKLEVEPGDILKYDQRMARLRGLKYYRGSEELYYYGVSYEEHDKFVEWHKYENIDIDGKCYRLMDYWPEPLSCDPDAINCGYIQMCHLETLNLIYNYLRMEVNTSKNKRRYTIRRNK